VPVVCLTIIAVAALSVIVMRRDRDDRGAKARDADTADEPRLGRRVRT
jgi:hypothetical protein